MGKRSRRRVESGEQTAAPTGATDFRGRVRESWKTAGAIDDATLARAREARLSAKADRMAAERKARQKERPPGFFGGLPVSEGLIFIGLILLVLGIIKGPQSAPLLFSVGLAMCGIATVEFTLREHLRGFRSHSFLISTIVMVMFHAIVAAIGGNSTAKSPVLFVLDAVLFGSTFFWLFRAYHRARRAAK